MSVWLQKFTVFNLPQCIATDVHIYMYVWLCVWNRGTCICGYIWNVCAKIYLWKLIYGNAYEHICMHMVCICQRFRVRLSLCTTYDIFLLDHCVVHGSDSRCRDILTHSGRCKVLKHFWYQSEKCLSLLTLLRTHWKRNFSPSPALTSMFRPAP